MSENGKSAFTVAFNTDNAAFDGADGDHEIARILREIAQRFEDGDGIRYGDPVRIRDINGNRIGFFAWSDTEEGGT